MTNNEMAKEYEENTEFIEIDDYGHKVYCSLDIEQAWLAGFEAGRLKWHKVADGDLPKVNSAVLDENGDKVVYIGGGEWEAYSEYYERYVGVGNPFAWCEIPQYINEVSK